MKKEKIVLWVIIGILLLALHDIDYRRIGFADNLAHKTDSEEIRN